MQQGKAEHKSRNRQAVVCGVGAASGGVQLLRTDRGTRRPVKLQETAQGCFKAGRVGQVDCRWAGGRGEEKIPQRGANRLAVWRWGQRVWATVGGVAVQSAGTRQARHAGEVEKRERPLREGQIDVGRNRMVARISREVYGSGKCGTGA